jgi:hypothetical protein
MVHTDDLSVRAKVIVGADGPLSLVGKAFGLGRSADLCPAVTVQVPGEFEPVPEMYFGTVAPGGYAWVIPKKGCANVGLGVSKKFAKMTVGEYFDEFVRFRGLEAGKPEGKVVPMSMPVRKTVSGQALIVGDAAGQVMAVNGGGIPMARITGKVAGTAAAANVLKGTSLQEYENEWRRQVYKPLRTAARTKVLAELCFGSAAYGNGNEGAGTAQVNNSSAAARSSLGARIWPGRPGDAPDQSFCGPFHLPLWVMVLSMSSSERLCSSWKAFLFSSGSAMTMAASTRFIMSAASAERCSR